MVAFPKHEEEREHKARMFETFRIEGFDYVRRAYVDHILRGRERAYAREWLRLRLEEMETELDIKRTSTERRQRRRFLITCLISGGGAIAAILAAVGTLFHARGIPPWTPPRPSGRRPRPQTPAPRRTQ